MLNNGICTECDGVMCFNPVPFSILDYMENSITQVLPTNAHLHQRLIMCEQQMDYPQISAPTKQSTLRKEAYDFKPELFKETDRKKQNQPTIDKWFKVIMNKGTEKADEIKKPKNGLNTERHS